MWLCGCGGAGTLDVYALDSKGGLSVKAKPANGSRVVNDRPIGSICMVDLVLKIRSIHTMYRFTVICCNQYSKHRNYRIGQYGSHTINSQRRLRLFDPVGFDLYQPG